MKRSGLGPLAFLLALAGVLSIGRAADPPKEKFTPRQRNYWAFQKVVRPALPAVKRASWVRTPVDAFILAKLEDKGIAARDRHG